MKTIIFALFVLSFFQLSISTTTTKTRVSTATARVSTVIANVSYLQVTNTCINCLKKLDYFSEKVLGKMEGTYINIKVLNNTIQQLLEYKNYKKNQINLRTLDDISNSYLLQTQIYLCILRANFKYNNQFESEYNEELINYRTVKTNKITQFFYYNRDDWRELLCNSLIQERFMFKYFPAFQRKEHETYFRALCRLYRQ